MNEIQVAGISITSEFLEWSLGGKAKMTLNRIDCFQKLFDDLRSVKGGLRVVCEIAGGAERVIVATLQRERIDVSVVESAEVLSFLQLSSTDEVDAQALRRYGLARRDHLRAAPPMSIVAPTNRRRPVPPHIKLAHYFSSLRRSWFGPRRSRQTLLRD
jgi:hypothetical protein